MTRPYQWDAPPFEGASFACLLVITDHTIKNNEQNELSDKLVKFGCKYAVCAGYNCSSWDDSIDFADLERCGYEPDDDCVMTTWHENEALEDIVWFFFNCTEYHGRRFENYLILFLGANKRSEDKIQSLLSNFIFGSEG